MTKVMMADQMHRLFYWRDLLRALVGREMKSRYQGSILGVFWSLMNPLLQLIVFHFIFRSVLQLNIPRYSSFAFSAMLAWSWFQSALLDASASMLNSRELVKRPGFPVGILPLVAVTTHFFYYLMALPILVIFLIIDGVNITSYICILPIVIIIQFIMTLSLGYLVAIANVLFHDTHYLLGLLLQLLFFLTPIFYDADVVPQSYQKLYYLNPMAQLVDAYRHVLIDGRAPDWWPMLLLTFLTSALLYAGLLIFKCVSYRFAEEV